MCNAEPESLVRVMAGDGMNVEEGGCAGQMGYLYVPLPGGWYVFPRGEAEAVAQESLNPNS